MGLEGNRLNQRASVPGGNTGRVPVRLFASACVAVVTMGAATVLPVRAESLVQALAAAYTNSPALRAELEQLRASDEDVAIANSNWRPSVIFQADAGYKNYETRTHTNDFDGSTSGISVTLSQPLFRGFRTINEVKQADALVMAGRQQFRAAEQAALLAGAQAYLDYARDVRVLKLRRRAYRLFAREYQGARRRFQLQDITRTDVAQARASFEAAAVNLESARADVAVSAANYLRYIGHPPGSVGRVRLPRLVPKRLETALLIAQRANPDVLKAVHKEIAARHFIKVKSGELLPKLSLEAEYDERFDLEHRGRSESATGVVRGVLTVPLYQAGRVYANIRKAKALHNRRQMLILDQRRKITAQVARVWRRMAEARLAVAARKREAAARQLAVTGVRNEALMGTRTTADILDAQRRATNTAIELVRAERDYFARGFELLAAIGKLSAYELKLPVKTPDTLAHHREVRTKAFGARLKTP